MIFFVELKLQKVQPNLCAKDIWYVYNEIKIIELKLY